MHRRFLCLLVAGTLVAPAAIAQQTDQPPLTFRAEANFVEVDAFVSDAAGKPITRIDGDGLLRMLAEHGAGIGSHHVQKQIEGALRRPRSTSDEIRV